MQDFEHHFLCYAMQLCPEVPWTQNETSFLNVKNCHGPDTTTFVNPNRCTLATNAYSADSPQGFVLGLRWE